MSGSTIGAVAGAIIGSFIPGVGTQIGWMVGSMIGGYVDPQKIEGPRLKDATRQTSQDGIPVPWGYGSFPTTGNLIWTDRLVETKSTKRQGKGGPKVTEYTYTRSYAVGVCEGEIAGFLIVKRNGKIVYDARPDSELTALGYTAAQIAESRAAQTKWLETTTLYYGNEVQLPDPTITAVLGSGNVPAYRGMAYIVATDEDLTNERGAVPQYEFVVSVCGTRTEEDAPEDWRWLGTGNTAAGLYAAIRPLSYLMVWTGSDTAVTGTTSTSPKAVIRYGSKMFALLTNNTCRVADVSAITTWSAGPTGVVSVLGHASVANGRLWVACDGGGIAYIDDENDASFTYEAGMIPLIAGWKGGVKAVTGNGTNVLCMDAYGAFYSSSDSGVNWTAGADKFGTGNRFYTSYGAMDSNGDRVVAAGGETNPKAYYTDDNGATFTACTMPTVANQPVGNQVKYCGSGRWLIACQDATTASNGLFKSTDNGVTFTAVTLPVALVFTIQSKQNIAVDGTTGRVVIAGEERGSGVPRYYYSDDLITWTEISRTGTNMLGIVSVYPPGYASPVTGTELPDATGHYVDDDGNVNGPAGTTIDRCTPELGADIVTDLCARRGVTDIDVSELTDLVDGFKIATETDPASAIDTTRAAYFYDASEYDGVIHFPKRGGAVAFALTMDDLAARDGDPIEWERVQEAELLRKVTVAYLDPATTYTQTTQKWERRTGTVEAKGEGSVEIPIVGTKDFAAQVAEMRGKAAWAETDKCRFSLPYKWAKLTPADVGTLTDALGKVHRIRILSIEDDSGYRHVEAVREQTNTYVSTAAGSSGPAPTYPGAGLVGPTVCAIMNLPVLRDTDDKAGLYIAAAGLLSGWQGALIQMSRNGATYENGPIIAANATMGELTATLATATRYAQDNTNTLSVRLLPTSGDLSSTTYDELIESEENAAAILYADGTAEIVQFQTATETAPGEYDLTGLMRGRQDTVIASHASGARFVLLDDTIRFAAIKSSDVTKTLTFRPVSVGSPPASNATQTITMTTIQSLREWSPYNVTIGGDGDGGYCVNWIGRARLGNSQTPAHSQWFAGYRVAFTIEGVTYEADTTEQSYCADAAELGQTFPIIGWPSVTVRAMSRIATNDDDFSSPPSGTATIPGVYTPQGIPASASVGPNGGYPDDAPYSIPTLTSFGVDVVPGGDFADAADLTNWRIPGGAALPSEWTVSSGALRYYGPGDSRAYCYPSRYVLMPELRYTVTVRADVQTDPGIQASIGIVTGRSSTSGGFPNALSTTQFSEYPDVTAVESSEVYSGSTGLDISNLMPAIVLSASDNGLANVSVDNVEMEVSAVSNPTTAQTLTNLDFSSGMTGWSRIPTLDPGAANVTTPSNVLTFEPLLANGQYTHFICDDPITLADAVGKYVLISAEVWSNDPTAFAGRTVNGVALGITYKVGGVYHYMPLLGTAYLRGDFTSRTAHVRIPTVAVGQTWHLCVSARAAVGYMAKVRSIAVEVTDAVV